MEKLKGKRLLLLGGDFWTEELARYAAETGVKLIATAKKAPTKLFEIAEENYRVDPTDAEGMKKLIREKKNRRGLPCYATPEQCAVLHEKIAFKELCDSVGLLVVKRIDIDEENLSATAAKIKYPVIAKPVDASGSAGCCVCRNAEEFMSGYAEAKGASFTGKVIVESFVDNRSVYLYYTFSGGKAYFTGVTRKYTVKYPQGNYVLSLRPGEPVHRRHPRALRRKTFRHVQED